MLTEIKKKKAVQPKRKRGKLKDEVKRGKQKGSINLV